MIYPNSYPEYAENEKSILLKQFSSINVPDISKLWQKFHQTFFDISDVQTFLKWNTGMTVKVRTFLHL